MARLVLTDVLSDGELLRQLLGPGARGPVGDVMKQVAATTVAVARRLADERLSSISTNPGDSYRDKFEIELKVAPRVEVIIKNTAEHAIFLEEGTEPHDITPVNAKMLRFFIPGQPNPVFTVHVSHPGNRAYRILGDALDIAIRQPFKPRF